MKKLLLLAIVVLGISAVSFGQDKTTLTGNNASATIIETLALTKVGTNELKFGTIGSPKQAAVITLDAATASRTGTADIVGNDGQTPEFQIKGEKNTTVTITLPTSLTISSDVNTMTVTVWKSDISDLANVGLGAGGQKNFKVGAQLNLNANQPAGTYTATYDVIVGYN
jgi:hypothetical protein